MTLVMVSAFGCWFCLRHKTEQTMSTQLTRRPLFASFFDDDTFGWPEGLLKDRELLPSRMFDRSFFNEMKMPAVNIKDNGTSFDLELAAPGYKKEDLKVVVKDGVLTISSEKKKESEEEKKGYTRKEFSYSSFSRSFVLPENVDPDSVKANFADGMLKIGLTKVKSLPEKQGKEVKIA